MNSSNSIALVCCCIVLTASIARAQFQLDITQLASVSAVQDEHILEEKPAQAGNNRFAVQQNIDAWVFNEHGNALRARKSLKGELNAQMQGLTNSFTLSPDQSEKLRMAGKGDIASYFAEIAVIRSEFTDQVNQEDFGKVWQRVQPLQMRMQRGLFSTGSMLQKVLKRTLNAEQLQEYELRERERVEFGYLAAVKLTVAELEKSTPLMQHQRRRIVELLEESERPKVLGQYLNYYVLYRLSKSQKQIEKILKPGQRKAWKQAFNQGQGMGQFLKQNGFIESL